MKKYTSPIIELTKFDVEDVIMNSGVSTSLGAGTSANKAEATQKLNTAGYTVVEW